MDGMCARMTEPIKPRSFLRSMPNCPCVSALGRATGRAAGTCDGKHSNTPRLRVVRSFFMFQKTCAAQGGPAEIGHHAGKPRVWSRLPSCFTDSTAFSN